MSNALNRNMKKEFPNFSHRFHVKARAACSVCFRLSPRFIYSVAVCNFSFSLHRYLERKHCAPFMRRFIAKNFDFETTFRQRSLTLKSSQMNRHRKMRKSLGRACSDRRSDRMRVTPESTTSKGVRRLRKGKPTNPSPRPLGSPRAPQMSLQVSIDDREVGVSRIAANAIQKAEARTRCGRKI